MQTINRPLKRSLELQPLSREHHHGLLFVWKIRVGLAASLSPYRIAKYCDWFWNTQLKHHMEQEEATLTKVLPAEHPLLVNMLDDHAAIRSKIAQVIEDPTNEGLKRLADIVYYHVRFEEHFLFPAIEKTATAEQLAQLGKELEQNNVPQTEWPDEFWARRPVAA